VRGAREFTQVRVVHLQPIDVILEERALHDAANALLTRATWFNTLKRWALDVARRRGMRRAKVALARKLATVLHRIWADGTEFVWGKDPAAAKA